MRSIVDALYMQWNSSGTKSKTNIPKLQITSEYAGSFPYMLEVSFFEFILHIFGLVIQILLCESLAIWVTVLLTLIYR